MRTALVIATAVAALAGCATGYGPQDINGGYTDSQVGPDLWRISVRGNAVTSAMQVEELALLRAADLAQQRGFTHFVVLQDRGSTATNVVPTAGTATTVGSSTFFRPGVPIMTRNETNSITVQMFKGRPADAQGIVYDSAFLMQSLGPKHIRR